ncbi:hypothetical protein ACROYT_G013618 [Oculina patagonica]
MVSIATAVFKAVLGLIVNKGRDLAAKRLKDGDVTDQQFRTFIVREIDDIKSKLDGIARKDLLASISFFKEGLVYLYKVLETVTSEADDTETVCQAVESPAAAASVETVSLATKELKKVQLTDQGNQDDPAIRALSDAKERFKDARRIATEAFNNEALNTADRILAMQYRVVGLVATLLEKVDNPGQALAACTLCLEELHSMPTIEREEIITSVCRVNRIIFDVTVQVDEGVNLLLWPCVDIGDDKVDPLRDSRLVEILRKTDMEHLYLAPWSIGQEGEEEHKLKSPCCIDVNTQGQLIVVDSSFIIVFDSSGKHLHSSSLPPDHPNDFCKGIAIDGDDNLYLLLGRWTPVVYVFDKYVNLHHQFNLTFCMDEPLSMTVNDSKKLLQVVRRDKVEMYDTINGRAVRSFGFERFTLNAHDITAANDDRAMVLACDKDCEQCIHVFSIEIKHLFRFNVKDSLTSKARWIAFQPESEQVVIMFVRFIDSDEYSKMFQIYTKHGEFVRSIHCDRIYDRSFWLTRNGSHQERTFCRVCIG